VGELLNEGRRSVNGAQLLLQESDEALHVFLRFIDAMVSNSSGDGTAEERLSQETRSGAAPQSAADD
jgi:hypothetical protein